MSETNLAQRCLTLRIECYVTHLVPKQHLHALSVCGAVLATLVATSAAHAAAPAPSGAHPRIWLTPDTVAGLKAQSQVPGSAVARGAQRCLKARQNPDDYSTGGWQGFEFVFTLSGCLISYKASGSPDDLATAIKYWNVLLDDYQTVGDGAGGDDVVTHDTGYAMRTFAAYAALGYDWLHDAPGVTESLRAHARSRFDAWMQFYSSTGYLKDMPGANYQAGYLYAATLIAIAEAGEAGAAGDSHWATVRDIIWGKDMAKALAPGGVLDGGDWPEGWQYGSLSVIEYSLAARALAENGAPVPGIDAWANSLALRYQYALTPKTQQTFVAGDADNSSPNLSPPAGPLVAVLAGSASDSHKAWARKLKAELSVSDENALFDALADATTGASEAFPETNSVNYLARGAGNWYVRSAWSDSAIWGVFQCAPRLVDDHQHNDAGNFVITRGGDDVVVDPSPYGSLSTLTGNAPAVDSDILPNEYSPSQAGWGTETSLQFAKQTLSGVAVARCDYADRFHFQQTPSDVPHALRDYVLIPSGGNATAVIVDRVFTGDPGRSLHLRVRTPGSLALAGDVATATVGSSSLAIRKLYASNSAANTREMPHGPECWDTDQGKCDASRLPSGTEYRIDVTGPEAFSIHVIDTAAAGTPVPASQLLSGPGYRGALIDREASHVAVITNDAVDGSAGASLGYRVPASASTTHVVFDAPSGEEGRSDVSAELDGSDCVVTITPHAGASGGFDARPLVMSLSTSCGLTEEGSQSPPVGGGGGGSGSGGESSGNGGAGAGGNGSGTAGNSAAGDSTVVGSCAVQGTPLPGRGLTPVAALLAALLFALKRRGNRQFFQPL